MGIRFAEDVWRSGPAQLVAAARQELLSIQVSDRVNGALITISALENPASRAKVPGSASQALRATSKNAQCAHIEALLCGFYLT